MFNHVVCIVCAGLGVGGDVVPALWLDLLSGRPSSHVWIYSLRRPTWTLGPQQHQGVFACVFCLQSLKLLCALVVHFGLRLSVLQSMVQVETLGELGVFFTLFVVGLEFSPERLRKVNDLHKGIVIVHCQ